MTNAYDALQPAHYALQSGDRETAKRLLAAALRADPQNVQAWLWMSEAADTDEQRRECLLRVLALEPGNQAAQAGLARLEKQALRDRPSRLETAATSTAPRGMETAATSAAPRGMETAATSTERGMETAATPADVRDWEIAAPQVEATASEHRNQVERYMTLAAGLSLTLLLGLALLLFALTRVIPQARDRPGLPSGRAVHTATLWCPSCERQGQPVILNTRIGASFYRGARASGLPHGTRVAVLRYRWSPLERRYYALVAAEGKRGWVPETEIRR